MGCRTREMKDRRNAEKEGYRNGGCRKRGIRERKDSGHSRGIHERRDSGQEVYRKVEIQERRVQNKSDAEQERFWSLGIQER